MRESLITVIKVTNYWMTLIQYPLLMRGSTTLSRREKMLYEVGEIYVLMLRP